MAVSAHSFCCAPDGVDARGSIRSRIPCRAFNLDFGRDGNAAAFHDGGWSQPEDGETWSTGAHSRLRLPAAPAGPFILFVHLRPYLVAGKLSAQRLRIAVNGIPVGEFTLQRKGVRACRIPAAVCEKVDALEIGFDTPDAACPANLEGLADQRALSVAVSMMRLEPDRFATPSGTPELGSDVPIPVDIELVVRADRIPLPDLMHRFESLGQNCEFGLVQRACGVDPLGLLRFASMPLSNLLAALDGNFVGMGTQQTVDVALSANGKEFMVTDTCFGAVYHAWVLAGEMTAEVLRKRELKRLPLLVRKLREDIEIGEKIFVFRGMGALAEEIAFPIAAMLRRYGPATLLFVTLADKKHRAGTVEARAPGFLVGYIERFARGDDAKDFLIDQWVAICRAALRVTIATATPAV